jgi:hypothetical protein
MRAPHLVGNAFGHRPARAHVAPVVQPI